MSTGNYNYSEHHKELPALMAYIFIINMNMI